MVKWHPQISVSHPPSPVLGKTELALRKVLEGGPPNWEKLSLSDLGGEYPSYLSPDTPETPASRRQGPECQRENPGDGNKGGADREV